MTDISNAVDDLPGWAQGLIAVAAAVAIVLIAHRIFFFIAKRAAARTATQTDDIFVQRLRRPTRWLLVAIALTVVQPGLDLPNRWENIWRLLAGLTVPALFGWLIVAVLSATNDTIQVRADISVADNLRARRRRTRAAILHRIALFVVMMLTFCLMLMSVPAIRTIGVTLAASAGLAALAVGAAAQPALKNLIAGLQMAFTEPIRIDDVVIIDAEWGRIEEIRLTYVVVRIWDDRRLVVPVSKFLEESFQNWTRETSQLMGSVFWHLDPAADIARIREKAGELIQANPRWDGRFWNVQVTDSKPETIEVRGLMTAKDAGTAFDLRCDIREGVFAFIREEMPEALPRRRQEIFNASSPGGGGGPPKAVEG
ncbi:mechanosensitive ion channel family protein [Sphingomonas sp. ID0503]|uniref:mechanosensitive ion channel family protein n=1 Tax=Sphingomonas sp. ID0503 TaxID=3399691 RepID=UPI003AFAE31D